jgi:hypothetical protein
VSFLARSLPGLVGSVGRRRPIPRAAVIALKVAALWAAVSLVPTDALAGSVRGYYRRDGTYVAPHYRSNPDGNPDNNYTYPGNVNPYTGRIAPGNPDRYLSSIGADRFVMGWSPVLAPSGARSLGACTPDAIARYGPVPCCWPGIDEPAPQDAAENE